MANIKIMERGASGSRKLEKEAGGVEGSTQRRGREDVEQGKVKAFRGKAKELFMEQGYHDAGGN